MPVRHGWADDPRWFMKPTHMCPEESVKTYMHLGGSGVMLAVHRGTCRLTDENPLEPPVRLREAWARQGLREGDLCLPIRGERRVVAPAPVDVAV